MQRTRVNACEQKANAREQKWRFSGLYGRMRHGTHGILAERVGFEPTLRFRKPHFECGAIDHSATSPQK
jgi:hypothetical protein